MWGWTDLSRAEYETAKARLLGELADASLTHPGIILHAAGIINTLRKFGDPVLGDDVPLEQYFKDYVTRLLDLNILSSDRSAFALGETGAAGLGYSSSETPEFQAISAMMKDAVEEIGRRKMREVAAGYIERLAASDDNYSSLYEYGAQDGNYAATPFLHYIKPREFARLLIADSRPNDHLFASLVKRYEYDHPIRNALTAEYDWTESLKAEMLDLIDAETAPFQHLLQLRVGYYFDKIGEGIGRIVSGG